MSSKTKLVDAFNDAKLQGTDEEVDLSNCLAFGIEPEPESIDDIFDWFLL